MTNTKKVLPLLTKAVLYFLLPFTTSNSICQPVTWYCLGETYFQKGNKDEALKSYKKSLRLNTAMDIKVNAEKKIKELE
jgi:tetratricopeptide (TPR) repeat protein